MIILSSEELEVIEYLKQWKGASISMLQICRCAGGRKKFKNDPSWAKALMGRLVEANLIEVNDRGHYRFPVENHPDGQNVTVIEKEPVREEPLVIGEDFFPSTAEPDPHEEETRWWVKPQLLGNLKNAKKKKGAHGR